MKTEPSGSVRIIGKFITDKRYEKCTYHSLQVSCATCLFDSGVDEQLIMNRTDHYKRTNYKAK